MRIRTVASLVVVGIALAGVLCATGCGSGTPSPAVTVTVTPSSQGTVKHYASSKYGFSLDYPSNLTLSTNSRMLQKLLIRPTQGQFGLVVYDP